MSLNEEQKKAYREELGRMEAQTIRDARKRLSTADFDPLAIIGRGAFGEVRTTRPWMAQQPGLFLLLLAFSSELRLVGGVDCCCCCSCLCVFFSHLDPHAPRNSWDSIRYTEYLFLGGRRGKGEGFPKSCGGLWRSFIYIYIYFYLRI